MFLLGLLCAFLIAVSAENTKSCYNDINNICNMKDEKFGGKISNCNAVYGKFNDLLPYLQTYSNLHIESSFELLLLSTHFGNYEYNRDGFKKLYRKLSDKTWEDAINIIKFITKKGGKIDFNRSYNDTDNNNNLEFNEITSLSKALDIEKKLATKALDIHSHSSHTNIDASVAHYIEEQFMEHQADTVRQLTGYIFDLKKLLKNNHPLSIFLFDEYLTKIM